MLFKEIPGNKIVKKELIKSVKKDRIAHAQLFLGKSGNAKLALAIAFAQFLNCEKRGETDSCNSCHSCLMYNSLSHPDLHLIFPVLKINKIKNPVSDNFISQWREIVLDNPYLSPTDWYKYFDAENKQGAIYTYEAEQLQKKVALKNYESAYRIILIWMPEKMNLTCANKLLKLIEEPPKGTFFLMASEDFEKLLPTITSRMQIVKTKLFSTEEITSFLQTQKGVTKEKSLAIAAIANGNINKAINLSQSEIEENSPLKDFQKWTQICYKVNLSELV
ncbi:MAG: DNA polymerase III subunit delta, partial [Bacteroidota bacterium]|nr:DNA polymerase III subunit delta [Bacteroidota bacterium]